MSPVIVDSQGQYVSHAYTGTVPPAGGRIVDLTPGDVQKLINGTHRWVSAEDTIAANQAWRTSTRAQDVLDATGDLPANLVRNILQDLVRVTQRQARQLNTFWRSDVASELVPVGDDDSGPGA
jgi:hypothetical protein